MATLAAPSVPVPLPLTSTQVADINRFRTGTSAIVAEVELATESYVKVLVDFSVAYRSFHKSLTPQVVIAAQALKKEFGVRQGFAGRTLKVEGAEMTWEGFVKKYFGISGHRFNQIVAIHDDVPSAMTVAKPARQKSVKVTPPDDEKRDLDEKFEQQEETIAELEERLEAADEEKAALEARIATIVEEQEEEIRQVEENTLAVVAGDWLECAVVALRDLPANRVKMELSHLLDELKLAGKLTVCSVE